MVVIYKMENPLLEMSAVFDTQENRNKAQQIFSATLGREVKMCEIFCEKNKKNIYNSVVFYEKHLCKEKRDRVSFGCNCAYHYRCGGRSYRLWKRDRDRRRNERYQRNL